MNGDDCLNGTLSLDVTRTAVIMCNGSENAKIMTKVDPIVSEILMFW